MKTCPQCQHEIADRSSFCPYCLYELEEKKIISPEPVLFFGKRKTSYIIISSVAVISFVFITILFQGFNKQINAQDWFYNSSREGLISYISGNVSSQIPKNQEVVSERKSTTSFENSLSISSSDLSSPSIKSSVSIHTPFQTTSADGTSHIPSTSISSSASETMTVPAISSYLSSVAQSSVPSSTSSKISSSISSVVSTAKANPVSMSVASVTKDTYHLNEPFENGSVTFAILYSDNHTEFTNMNYGMKGFSTSAVGKVQVIFTYYGYDISCTYEFTVVDESGKTSSTTSVPHTPENAVGSNIWISIPDKMVYHVGEAFDPTGLMVSVQFPDGVFFVDGYTISGFDSSKPGTVYLHITYGKCSGGFTVTIIE